MNQASQSRAAAALAGTSVALAGMAWLYSRGLTGPGLGRYAAMAALAVCVLAAGLTAVIAGRRGGPLPDRVAWGVLAGCITGVALYALMVLLGTAVLLVAVMTGHFNLPPGM